MSGNWSSVFQTGRRTPRQAPRPLQEWDAPQVHSARNGSDDKIHLASCAGGRPPIEEGRVPLVDLEEHHCRWVTKPAPGALFCGRHKNIGSYCNEHAALVYAKMMVREDEDAQEQKPKNNSTARPAA